MATIKEMALSNEVLQLAMQITAQGEYNVMVGYAGHVDGLNTYIMDGSGNYVEGWNSVQHTIYLGQFHVQHGFSSVEAESQLVQLLADLGEFLQKDADGIPV